MAEYAHQTISDQDYARERNAVPALGLRSKEEVLYYRIFREQYGDRIPQDIIGRTRSVTQRELN